MKPFQLSVAISSRNVARTDVDREDTDTRNSLWKWWRFGNVCVSRKFCHFHIKVKYELMHSTNSEPFRRCSSLSNDSMRNKDPSSPEYTFQNFLLLKEIEHQSNTLLASKRVLLEDQRFASYLEVYVRHLHLKIFCRIVILQVTMLEVLFYLRKA